MNPFLESVRLHLTREELQIILAALAIVPDDEAEALLCRLATLHNDMDAHTSLPRLHLHTEDSLPRGWHRDRRHLAVIS